MSTDPLAPLLALPGIAEAVDASRAAVDALLKEPALRTRRPQVRAAALARAATASAALERPAWDGAEEASVRVLAELGMLAGVWGRAPLQALARLHALAAAGVVPDDQLGRPRAAPEVSARLTALSETAVTSTAPGVVVAAVVHGELLALAPFSAANGLVARAAQRLVLVQRGVDPDALTLPEEGLLQLGSDRYVQAADGFAAATADGVAAWVTLVAASVQRGAMLGRELCAEVVG